MVKFCFCALCKYKIMFSRSIISTRLSALVAVQNVGYITSMHESTNVVKQ